MLKAARFAFAAIAVLGSTAIVQVSYAATWRPISMIVDPTGLPTVFGFVLNNFSDTVYNESNYLLTNNPNPPTLNGPDRTTITFQSDLAGIGAPPFVDATARTINVSSIYAEGWVAYDVCGNSGTCDPQNPVVWQGMIGWDFGPLDPVPYVVNSDGSFTATWNATDARVSMFNGFGNKPISFTFAAVPLPLSFWLLVSGLGGLLGLTKWPVRRANA